MKLEDPKTIRMIRVASIVVLVILVILDLAFAHHHHHFTIDTWPGFYSWYGFGTCVIMVFASKKIIGWVLRKPDSYYETLRELGEQKDGSEDNA